MQKELSSSCIYENGLITGATSGIGEAFFNRSSNLVGEWFQLGRKVQSKNDFLLDLSKPMQSQLNSLKIDLPEKIDLLVLCAGSDVGGRQKFLEQPIEKWKHTIDVNYLHQIELVHFLLPKILSSKTKTILFVSSQNIDKPPLGCVAYTSAKAAFSAAMQCISDEYKSEGLKVIEIRPGLVKTNFAFNRTNNKSESEAFYESHKPFLSPELVAERISAELTVDQRDTDYRLVRL